MLQDLVYLYGGNSIVPSLFPFLIATELLSSTGIIEIIGKKLNKYMKPIFNISGEGAFPLIMGIITGYPVGAKIVSNLKDNGIISNLESERLIAFTNNSGPLFILGTIGITLFGNSHIGLLLLVTHILSSLSVGFIFRWWKCKQIPKQTKKTNFEKSKVSLSIGNIIINSINTLLLIGGFVTLFSVVISILVNSKMIYILCNILNPFLKFFNISPNYSLGIISGLIEVTNGIYNISLITTKTLSTNIIICSFILGTGGLSVAMQVYSIISKSNISIKPYIIGKLLQGVLAAFYTFLILNTFTFINFNL